MKSALYDFLQHVSAYGDMDFVTFETKDGHTEAFWFPNSKTVLVSANFPVLDDIDGIACFGNLKFLHKLVGTDNIRGKDGRVEVTNDDQDGQTALKELKFIAPRLRTTYRATSPKAIKTQKPKLQFNEWPFEIDIDQEFYKQFADAVSLNGISNPKDDIVTVRSIDGKLVFLFGSDDNQIELLVGDCSQQLGPVKFKVSRLGVALNLACKASGQKGAPRLSINQKMVKVVHSTNDGEYTTIVPFTSDV